MFVDMEDESENYKTQCHQKLGQSAVNISDDVSIIIDNFYKLTKLEVAKFRKCLYNFLIGKFLANNPDEISITSMQEGHRRPENLAGDSTKDD